MNLYVDEIPKSCNDCIFGQVIYQLGCGVSTICATAFTDLGRCPLTRIKDIQGIKKEKTNGE